MYVRTYVRTYVRMYVCVYVYMYVHIHINIYIYTHIHTHTCVSLSLSLYIYIYIYMYIHTYKRTPGVVLLNSMLLCMALCYHVGLNKHNTMITSAIRINTTLSFAYIFWMFC